MAWGRGRPALLRFSSSQPGGLLKRCCRGCSGHPADVESEGPVAPRTGAGTLGQITALRPSGAFLRAGGACPLHRKKRMLRGDFGMVPKPAVRAQLSKEVGG